ncbi:TPA: hypothetical protein QCJ76_002540 [Enterobacter asburiae]|nr:hypothetical protein [Enterobacter asburiae]
MSDLVHTISVLSVRIAGVVSAGMLVTGGSRGNYTLLAIEVLFLVIWAETEYREYKERKKP